MSDDLKNVFSGASQRGAQDIANGFNTAIGNLPDYFKHANDAVSPWQQAGTRAVSGYEDFLNKLKGQSDNPNAWMDNYQESPNAKFQTKQALNAADNAAAGAGLLGGIGSRTGDMNIAQGIASKDMQQYFDNMMRQEGAYGGGLSDLSHQGLSAGGIMAELAKALGGDMTSLVTGQAAAQGAADQAGTSGKNSAVKGITGGVEDAIGF